MFLSGGLRNRRFDADTGHSIGRRRHSLNHPVNEARHYLRVEHAQSFWYDIVSSNLCMNASKQIAGLSLTVFRFDAQTQFIVNPRPFLMDLTGQTVKVKLKWGMEYQGKLESADAYMNLQLTSTDEYLDGQYAGYLGEVLIRCNNVLYIVAAPASVASEEPPATGNDVVMATD
jgi:small nuclear ribonucleoprotein F